MWSWAAVVRRTVEWNGVVLSEALVRVCRVCDRVVGLAPVELPRFRRLSYEAHARITRDARSEPKEADD